MCVFCGYGSRTAVWWSWSWTTDDWDDNRERESEIDTIGYIERDALVMKARHLLQCCKSENMICCKCLSVIFYIFLAFPSGAVKGLDAHAARGGDSLPLRRQTHPVWTIMNTLSWDWGEMQLLLQNQIKLKMQCNGKYCFHVWWRLKSLLITDLEAHKKMHW